MVGNRLKLRLLAVIVLILCLITGFIGCSTKTESIKEKTTTKVIKSTQTAVQNTQTAIQSTKTEIQSTVAPIQNIQIKYKNTIIKTNHPKAKLCADAIKGRIILFDVQDFNGGYLALAAYDYILFYKNYCPSLYYIKDNKVTHTMYEQLSATYINYTVFNGKTIFFDWACYPEEPYIIRYKFSNGETKDISININKDDYKGYFIIVDGEQYVTNKYIIKNNKITEQNINSNVKACSGVLKNSPKKVLLSHYYAIMEKVDRQYTIYFVKDFMYSKLPHSKLSNYINLHIKDDKVNIETIWRTGRLYNGIDNIIAAEPNEDISFRFVDRRIRAFDDYQVAWIDIMSDDGNKTYKDLVASNDIKAPGKPGIYCLILYKNGYKYAILVEVVDFNVNDWVESVDMDSYNNISIKFKESMNPKSLNADNVKYFNDKKHDDFISLINYDYNYDEKTKTLKLIKKYGDYNYVSSNPSVIILYSNIQKASGETMKIVSIFDITKVEKVP